ncbi:MAG: RIP metalloprotease RseP [candidate division Zixibacteria bacterium]
MLITILATVFVLGVLIFFHELGHFIAAKRAGIKVEKFSLGFPPAIIKKKVGETEYSIGLVPLGGFVKMAGELPGEESTGAAYEFMSKSVGARAIVVAAGPIMNFVIAFLILWGIFFVNGEEVASTDQAVIGVVAEGSPAEGAGIVPGDMIVRINDSPITTFESMARIISTHVEEPITVIWIRDDIEMSVGLTTYSEEVYNEKGEKVPIGMMGVGQQTTIVDLGFFESGHRGLAMTWYFTKNVYKFVYDLVTAQISPKMIGGPVFIAQAAGAMAKRGLIDLLAFMALLSVNLAILNILPIPVLDGGHLIFLLIEKLKGKPLSLNQRAIAQQIGLVFLLVVIIMVTYNDIVRVITG